jgi:hypothetical protein
MMLSRFVLAAGFLGSFLPSLVMSGGEDGPDANITTSEDQYVFWSYYSDADCSSPVGLFGSVALEEATVPTTPNTSCAQEVSCLFDPQSAICTSLEPSGIAVAYDAVLPDGDLILCDSTNPLTNEDVCVTYPADSCHQSSAYPSCKAGFVRQDELADPTLFSNENTEDQAALSEYYYLVYYDNTDCTSPVGLRAFVSGEEYELPILSDEVTCEDAMACLYSSDGDLCKQRGGGSSGAVTFTFTIFSGEDNKLSSNPEYVEDYSGEPDFTPEQCTQSLAFVGPPCLFRVVSASYLARNPGGLVGEFGGGSDENMETSLGTMVKHSCAFLFAISMVLSISQ